MRRQCRQTAVADGSTFDVIILQDKFRTQESLNHDSEIRGLVVCDDIEVQRCRQRCRFFHRRRQLALQAGKRAFNVHRDLWADGYIDCKGRVAAQIFVCGFGKHRNRNNLRQCLSGDGSGSRNLNIALIVCVERRFYGIAETIGGNARARSTFVIEVHEAGDMSQIRNREIIELNCIIFKRKSAGNSNFTRTVKRDLQFESQISVAGALGLLEKTAGVAVNRRSLHVRQETGEGAGRRCVYIQPNGIRREGGNVDLCMRKLYTFIGPAVGTNGHAVAFKFDYAADFFKERPNCSAFRRSLWIVQNVRIDIEKDVLCINGYQKLMFFRFMEGKLVERPLKNGVAPGGFAL